jgi:3-hydroxymyristoyl/3-hydroxydecanoyl-(acyl carrier protein) dehydratase
MQLQLIVPRTHPCFADHFPGKPLVPGALLLHWLCQQVQAHTAPCRVTTIKSMKFLQPLLPGDVCQLVLTAGASAPLLKVKLTRDGTTICQGVLEVQAEGADCR